MKTLLWILALGTITVAALLAYGNARWNAGTTQLLTQLDAAQIRAAPQFFNSKELDVLPAPVKRYFQKVLKDGQPIITAATVQHSGTFNMGETTDNWKPFTSTQRVVTQRPGFHLLLEPELSIVLFTVDGWSRDGYLAWSRKGAGDGRFLVVPTTWKGEPCLRICLVHPNTRVAALHELLDDLASCTPA